MFARRLSFAAAAVLAPCAAQAHHSVAPYDRSQTVTLAGEVTRIDWANPHVYLFVEQDTDAGETVEWEIEAYNPGWMRRLGWSPDSLSAGDRITLSGNPARNPDRKNLLLVSIQQGDEALFDAGEISRELATPGGAPEAGTSDLDGTWAVRSNVIVSLPFLHQWVGNLKLTEAGAAALESFDEQTMLPLLNCVPNPAPNFMIWTDLKRITTEGDEVRIVGDGDAGGERVIHMDLADHEGATRSVQGHSIGRWERDTLVIDTTHFTDHRTGNAFGVPSGAQKHLVERLTLDEDGTSLTYAFEVADPEFLAAPMTGEVEWVYRPNLELSPETCDVESARRFTDE